jgi:predicted amidohydrolase YtcJ
MWWERDAGIEQLEGMLERSRTGTLGRLRLNSVKLMLDGVLETFTGAMLDPYLDADGRPGTNRGIAMLDPEQLPGWVTAIDAAGLQPHFHAIGDRAVRMSLDAVEAARSANGHTDTRPHVAHIQVIHPDDLPRFNALGMIANAQALWAVAEAQMTELTIPFLGPERSGWQYPFQSLLRHGARLAMGSDWSVSTPDPILQIDQGVTRMIPDELAREAERPSRTPFLPHERLTLEQAIRGFTAGSAFANHLDETGTIEVGKLADLAILDRDPFAADAGPIWQSKVIGTMVGGELVFEAAALG